MKLYIDGTAADLSEAVPIQMNYSASDLASPAAVKNSFSQQITLPATPTNDAIFGAIFRADHRTVIGGGGFNPLQRTPFLLFNEAGEVLESGYLKLDTITNKNGVRGYVVTLYGGLGSFFYSLSYDEQGETLTLGDLPLVSDDPGDKTDFTITADVVASAWDRLAGDETAPAQFDAVNFAPAYNGFPDADFSADKAIGNPQEVGGMSSQTEDGVNYTTYKGYALYDLGEDFTEWQTKDLRSYLQRPVVSVRALFAGITRYAQSRGFSLGLDPGWFHDKNPYFAQAWMTLPLLSTRSVPARNGVLDLAGSGWLPSVTSYVDAGAATQTPTVEAPSILTARCTPLPWVTLRTDPNGSMVYLNRERNLTPGAQVMGCVFFAQVQILDAGGTVVGASPIQVYASSHLAYGASTIVSLAQLEGFYMKGDVNPTIYYSDMYRTDETYKGRAVWMLEASQQEGDAPELTATGTTGVAVRIAFAYRTVGFSSPLGGMEVYRPYGELQVRDRLGDALINVSAAGCVAGAPAPAGQLTYETPTTVRSNVPIPQETLFSGTMSPMQFLLSYTKTFGLQYLYDSARRRAQIVTRNTLYGGGSILDFEQRIDRSKEIRTVPIPMSAKWLEFAPDETEGEFPEYYKKKYGRAYGVQKVSTGYEFDAETTEVLTGARFNGGAEVLELSKYFNNVTFGGKTTPSPFLNGQASYTLYARGDVAGDTLELEGLTPTAGAKVAPYVEGLAGYDMIPKLQCHGTENSPNDGAGILLIHRGSIADVAGAAEAYARFRLTDDIAEMYDMNDGTPCWNFSGTTPATAMPVFGRFERDGDRIARTLDLGLPAEIDQPLVTVAEHPSVYERCWAAYIADRYNVDARVCTAWVHLRGLAVGPELMRSFYYFDGAIWALNKIINYALGSPATTQCEFVKVQDRAAYTEGQILDAPPVALTIQLSTDGEDLYVLTSRPLEEGERVSILTRGAARNGWLPFDGGARQYSRSTYRWHINNLLFTVSANGKIVVPAVKGKNTYRWRIDETSDGQFLHIRKASWSRKFGYRLEPDMDRAVTFAVAVVTGKNRAAKEVSNRVYFESRAHVRGGVLTQEFVVAQ